MKTSLSVKEIFSALSKAQGQIESAKKSQENAFFSKPTKKSTYADIADVIEVIRKPAMDNGLSVIFNFKTTHDDGKIIHWIQYKLLHEIGEFIEGDWVSMLLKDNTQHSFGSSNTYYRRQLLKAIYQIPEEDDDGNKQSVDADTQPPHKPQQSPKPFTEPIGNNSQQVKPLVNHAPQSQIEAMLPSKFATRDVVANLYAIGRAMKYSDDEIKRVVLNTSGAKSMNEIPTMAVGVIKAYLESNEPGNLK